MAENEMPAKQVRSVMTKNLEQAQGAIANYFQLVEKSILALPMGATDQTKTFRNYVEQSVAASFGLSDKLLRAKAGSPTISKPVPPLAPMLFRL